MELACDRYGTARSAGRPIVLLHGLLGSARNWATIAKRLAKARPVIAVDLRNHGRSPWDARMDYAAMAADVAGLIETLGADVPVVLGHSMGGKAAMTLALTQPRLVGALVVVDIAPVGYDGAGFLRYVEAMRALDLEGADRRVAIDADLARAVPEAAIRAFLLQNLESADGRFRWRPNLDALADNMEALRGFPEPPAGSAFDGPTLVIRGARSDYVLPEHRAGFERLFPSARHVAVKGAGHWVHAEQPERFSAVLEPFLAALDAEGAATRSA